MTELTDARRKEVVDRAYAMARSGRHADSLSILSQLSTLPDWRQNRCAHCGDALRFAPRVG
jgi:hypothetical protein